MVINTLRELYLARELYLPGTQGDEHSPERSAYELAWAASANGARDAGRNIYRPEASIIGMETYYNRAFHLAR